MSLPFAKFIAVATVLAASSLAAPIEPGKQFFHKDWAAACDNVYSCEALSLAPEVDGGDTAPAILISRESPNDAVTVKISLTAPTGDRYRILVDGREVDRGALAQGEWAIVGSAANSLKLARAIGRGRNIVIRGDDGGVLGKRTLKGSAAALIHIDLMQNRARTRNALFLVGRRALPVRSVALPVITATRIGEQSAVPDAGTIIDVVENSKCSTDSSTVTENSAVSLGKKDGQHRVLLQVSCGNGAYNMAVAPYVGSSADGKKWTFAPARFDYPDQADEGMDGVKLLSNPSWDAATQQLGSFHKARGLGDCGTAQTYVWDGDMFRLVEVSAMDECRGSTEWMQLWRARVEFKG